MVGWLLLLLMVVCVNVYVYDKHVQRTSSLLINYPVLARMRYVFELFKGAVAPVLCPRDFL